MLAAALFCAFALSSPSPALGSHGKDPKPPAKKKKKFVTGFTNLKKWVAQGPSDAESLEFDGRLVEFVLYPRIQLAITSKCQAPQKKLKCMAFSALRQAASVQLTAAELNAGDRDAQARLCQKVSGYTRDARLEEPRRRFCWFSDDSAIELSSLRYFWSLQQAGH